MTGWIIILTDHAGRIHGAVGPFVTQDAAIRYADENSDEMHGWRKTYEPLRVPETDTLQALLVNDIEER